MILPRVTGNFNPQSELLNSAYERSIKVLKDTIDSAHSKTLDELYTNSFRPYKTKSDTTTVKSLKTGKPVDINLKYRLTDGEPTDINQRLKYYAYLSKNNTYLGSKTFGIVTSPENEKTFEGGFICSTKNNDYSGVQIRLLQAACEEANRNGIKSMPLCSLLPSLKFHTMMGFRPIVSHNREVRSLSDIAKETQDFCRDYRVDIFEEDVVPILSKTDDAYYFDRNRTLFCATMKRNEKILGNDKRNISLSNQRTDSSISMELSGEEFDKWIERSKGFEIMSDNGGNPKKLSWTQKAIDIVNLFRYGG